MSNHIVEAKPWRLVLLPKWLVTLLESNNLPIRYALDIHALSRILSLNDVSFYAAINIYLFQHMHESLKQTFIPANILDPFEYLLPEKNGQFPNADVINAGVTKITSLVNNQYSLDGYKPSGCHLLDILPHNELYDVKEKPIEVSELQFKIQSIDIDIFGVTFDLKDKKENPVKQTLASLYDSLALVSGLYDPVTVARTELFKSYARLSKQSV